MLLLCFPILLGEETDPAAAFTWEAADFLSCLVCRSVFTEVIPNIYFFSLWMDTFIATVGILISKN